MPAISTTAEARAMLVSMLQPDATPALTTEEVDRLLSMALVPDLYGTAPDYIADWSANKAYNLGTRISPTDRGVGYAYVVTTAGTSGATEPDFTGEPLETIIDNTVIWTRSVKLLYTPTWNLARSAAEGWEWKASKVASQYDVQAGKVKADRSQIFQMCKQQAAHFRSLAGGSSGSSSIGWIILDTTH